MKYKIMYTTVYEDNTSDTETALKNVSFEDCQRILQDLFGYLPNQIIEDETFGRICIEGFKVGKAYEVMPACPPEQKCYYHIQPMK